MTYKFCVDCKWFLETGREPEGDGIITYWCKSPNGERNLVTGTLITLDCIQARYSKNQCGRGAKWFQPK